MSPLITKSDTLSVTETLVPMHDGVRLYTRIMVPQNAGKCPVVFIRTPYEKSLDGKPFDISHHEYDIYSKHGYAVVVQHTRGRGDSEGDCHPFFEKDDGLDTLDYIRKLPFYNGEIFLAGGSYLATAHLSYLSAKPKDIKGAVIDIQTDRINIRNYRNGCCYKFCNYSWWVSMLNRRYPVSSTDKKLKRPFKTVAEQLFGEDVPEYTESLMNDCCSNYWESYPAYHAAESIDFPVLFRDGWYDFYLEGMFDMWSRLSDDTKDKSSFVIGPWGHGMKLSPENEFPMKGHELPPDHAVDWFDSIRENRPYRYAERGKITFHSIGGDSWKIAESPDRRDNCRKFYFAPDKKLTVENSDGDISYKYDPQKENKLFKYGAAHIAFPIDSRDDTISFVSDEVMDGLDFFGNIRWHMNVSSSCDDTAFFIRVYLVREGNAYNLTETITSLSHINPDYKRGMIQQIDLCTPPIGFTLKKGDRIRADISSNGSIYVPHSNLKCHWAKAPKTRIAVNTIYFKDGFLEF